MIQGHLSRAAVLLSLLFSACTTSAVPADKAPTKLVTVIQSFPHDANAFCQGFAVEGERVFEGTGQYGNSSLRHVDLKTGRPIVNLPLKPQYFGEGITIIGDLVYQLTWKERLCFVYDKNTLKYLKHFQYAGEGWGLTDDGKVLYMSDGTSTIRVVDPATFKVLRKIRVKNGRRTVGKLNELEFVNGKIWANVWYEDRIAEIDPASGRVTAWIDCSNVYPANSRPDREHVLNGIAFDENTKRIFVTGKNWPRVYEISVNE